MGDKTLVYKNKLKENLSESKKHMQRLDNAIEELSKLHSMPLEYNDYSAISNDLVALAFTDQIIYRFSKLQDCMGAKLFKSLLLYQGENTDKPFLDILNQLEKMDIVTVDDWFEMRDLRNEIAHDYEDNDKIVIQIINAIYSLKVEMAKILQNIEKLIDDDPFL